MSTAIITANLGGFDKELYHAPLQTVQVVHFNYTDANFPPRPKSMTPRLQAKIPKMMGWDMNPGFFNYLWMDASLRIKSERTVQDLNYLLKDADFLVFEHPERHSISEEYHFIKARMERPGETYLTSRYEGEPLDELYKKISDDIEYNDDEYFIATAFMYRPTTRVKWMMRDWLYQTFRYHLIDQLQFTYLLKSYALNVKVIKENYLKSQYFDFIRGK